MSKSVAFKLNYNDGGEDPLVGFAGTCSKDNIYRNVSEGRPWCSDRRCKCRVFKDRGMKGGLPARPCQESKLFVDWRFGAGGYTTGEKKEQSIPLRQAGVGNFAVLTTRFPSDAEEDRRIVGLFRIDKVEGNTVASLGGGVRLPVEEAKKLFFWAYCTNAAKRPTWKEGLFRYLEDGQVHRILADVALTVRDENCKERIQELVRQRFKGEPPKAKGCLPERSTTRAAVVAALRKYGPGGEGEDHKRLKEWIARNPRVLHLSDVSDVAIERRFLSGDSADIVFTRARGQDTVVEIETNTPHPGAHQAVKYRALLCAEKGIRLDASSVRAILVAWSIPPETRAFCGKYNVAWQECKLPVGKTEFSRADI